MKSKLSKSITYDSSKKPYSRNFKPRTNNCRTVRDARTHTLQQELQTKETQLQIKDQQLQASQRCTHTLQQELQINETQLQTKDQQLQDSQRQTQQLTQQVEEKQHTIDDKETLLRELNQSNKQITAEFQQNLLQHEQGNKQLQNTFGQLRRDLQQAVEEKQAGERRLRELNQQLLKMSQVGALPHETTITPPRPEQQSQRKQHATEDEQLQPMKRPGPVPQEIVLQHATGDEQLQPMKRPGPVPQEIVLQHATGDEQLQPMKRPGPVPQEIVLQHATKDEQLQPMKRPGPLPQKTVLQHATEDEQLQPMKQPGPLPQKTVMQQKAIRYMRWQKESKAPEKMRRGSAAADSNMAYFNDRGSTTVHSYDSDTRKWHQLPDAPHKYSTLVVVHHVLTMVGGRISGGATDSLLSLMGEGRDIKWLPNLPAMPTKRYDTAVVCSGHSLIVAGGYDGRNKLATVEVLDTDTRQWSIASSLTHPFSEATISICGERLYMLGGYDQTDKTHSVLNCSVPELLQSCQPQPTKWQRLLRTAPANQSTIWQYVADAPHSLSSCTTLCGQLVAVGGGETGLSASAISGYNETTGFWEAMGNMPTARRLALVAILNGKMMVIGGWVGVFGTVTDAVEILC